MSRRRKSPGRPRTQAASISSRGGVEPRQKNTEIKRRSDDTFVSSEATVRFMALHRLGFSTLGADGFDAMGSDFPTPPRTTRPIPQRCGSGRRVPTMDAHNDQDDPDDQEDHDDDSATDTASRVGHRSLQLQPDHAHRRWGYHGTGDYMPLKQGTTGPTRSRTPTGRSRTRFSRSSTRCGRGDRAERRQDGVQGRDRQGDQRSRG